VKRASLLVLLAACGAPAKPAPAPPAAHTDVWLQIEPAFDTLAWDGWAGVSQYTDLVGYGFSPDSTQFASCHPDLEKSGGVCDFLDTATGKVTKTVPVADRDARRALLESLGITANPVIWDRAEKLTWTAEKTGDIPDQLDFFLGDRKVATFDAPSGMAVYPDAALVSPDAAHLAIVVFDIGGPPLTTDVKIVAP
jgi:hypothetical protein